MTQYRCFTYPNVPADLAEQLFREDKKLVVVGVLGKSAFPDCNKMRGFEVLDNYPSLTDEDGEEGRIKFYYKQSEQMIFLHFETMFDQFCMEKLLTSEDKPEELKQFMSFNSHVRTRFARILLFAIHVCHMIIMVETNSIFDASYLSLFKSLKIIREKHVLKFLPKLVKNSNVGSFLKDGRLCSPRFMFFFESLPQGFEDNDADISKLEFEVEDSIYKMLRTEFIITNNSSMSLFSIPGNKRFVYYNTDATIRDDPLIESKKLLTECIAKFNQKYDSEDELDELRPYKGYGKPIRQNSDSEQTSSRGKRSFLELVNEHVTQAQQSGFDDSMSKYKGKSHFVIPNMKSWYEVFKQLLRIFIENPNNPNFEANDNDYKSYLENFHRIIDIDEEFFIRCCDAGLKKALALYNNHMMTHYGRQLHEQMVEEAVKLYLKYARGPQTSINEKKLRDKCEQIWKTSKQQCEYASLRGNPCILAAKHTLTDPTEHSSGVVFVSACNCGRTQGRREDPYTVRQANYDFFLLLAANCVSCNKLEKINFAVFEPSINDYKPAELDRSSDNVDLAKSVRNFELISQESLQSIVSQAPHVNLSLESMNDLNKIRYVSSDEDSVNELVITVGVNNGSKTENAAVAKGIVRQPSTTEYLPGMVHQEIIGLLPQFPSWSLVCVGPSSVYSHNTGLAEHFQSGFLSGSNFLLPWDAHVRLEHSESWAATYEKQRYRKKGQALILKIFIGCEYECPRGHRFIMSSPDKVLRGGSGIVRDSGSKVVYNDMPLYFPCPCRNTKPMVAQLTRVHCVTPKAPVTVTVDPKVKIEYGENKSNIFTTGNSSPAKLTQSSYWILRLPYIYQGDDGAIQPPGQISVASSMYGGCLLAGMYGVSETEI